MRKISEIHIVHEEGTRMGKEDLCEIARMFGRMIQHMTLINTTPQPAPALQHSGDKSPESKL